MPKWEMIEADCLEEMQAMVDEGVKVDSIVTDPPYLISFMSKNWDNEKGVVGSSEVWKLCYQLLKPGGHMLVFGGTRTHHRVWTAIEDAGFEIRDTLSWMYGSGMPKSFNISKGIDRHAGAEREVVGSQTYVGKAAEDWKSKGGMAYNAGGEPTKGLKKEVPITAPATPEAQQWEGWGTGLKPAFEIICLARKPLEGTVVNNVLNHGVGGLNIDGCRIGFASGETSSAAKRRQSTFGGVEGESAAESEARGKVNRRGSADVYHAERPAEQLGRWPANLLLTHHPDCEFIGYKTVERGRPTVIRHDLDGENTTYGQGLRGSKQIGAEDQTMEEYDCHEECPVRMLDEQVGHLHGAGNRRSSIRKPGPDGVVYPGARAGGDRIQSVVDNAGGSATRFFYISKVSPKERNAGLDNGTKNAHPTLKPIQLLRYLCRLITPPGGHVLDPFAGAGSTGCAAVLEGFRFTGIEKEAEYMDTATARIRYWHKQDPNEAGKPKPSKRRKVTKAEEPSKPKRKRRTLFDLDSNPSQ